MLLQLTIMPVVWLLSMRETSRTITQSVTQTYAAEILNFV
jgi:hypothetical protein